MQYRDIIGIDTPPPAALGIYFFVKGETANGLLALILSGVAFNLSLQILFYQSGRGEFNKRR